MRDEGVSGWRYNVGGDEGGESASGDEVVGV